MKPQNELFQRQIPKLEERSGALLRSAEIKGRIEEVSKLLYQDNIGTKVAAPGISQVRTAVQRQLKEHGVVFPNGDVFSSDDYDYTIVGDSDVPSEAGIGLGYVSRIYAVSSERESGKIIQKLDELFDGPKPTSSNALIHTLTPKAAGRLFDTESITFVLVQVKGGVSYCFQLSPNDNKGKVIPETAMQTEYGELRDSVGYIDTCHFKATAISPADQISVSQELESVLTLLKEKKPKKETKSEKAKRYLGTVSNTMTTKLNATRDFLKK